MTYADAQSFALLPLDAHDPLEAEGFDEFEPTDELSLWESAVYGDDPTGGQPSRY